MVAEKYTFNVRVYRKEFMNGILIDTDIVRYEGLIDVKVNDGYLVFAKPDNGGIIFLPDKGTFVDVIPVKIEEDNGVYQ